MTGWQPIETAPRDGTRIRLANANDPSSMRLNGLCKTFGSFNGRAWDLSSYFTVPGGRYGLMSCEPTHWMPIAPTPEASGEGQ